MEPSEVFAKLEKTSFGCFFFHEKNLEIALPGRRAPGSARRREPDAASGPRPSRSCFWEVGDGDVDLIQS